MPVTVQKRILTDTEKKAVVQFNFLNTGTICATGGMSSSLGVTSDFGFAVDGQQQSLKIARVFFTLPSAAVYSVNFGISGGGLTQGLILNGGSGTVLDFYNSGINISNPLPAVQQSGLTHIHIRNEASIPADTYSTVVLEFTKIGYRGS